MKRLSLNIIVIVLKNLPNSLLRITVDYLCSNNGYYSKKILFKTPFNKLVDSKSSYVKKYHILTDIESSAYKVKVIDEERYEKVRTPDVYEVSKDNFVTLRKHEIAIYCFQDARILAKSDIIKMGEAVFWEKANRPEFAQTLPLDSDFILIDKLGREVICFEGKGIRYFDNGFNLCGVHTNTWAHFIISYLPKLIALDQVDVSSKLSLFVPRNILDNNKDLILLLLSNLNLNEKLAIVYVDDDEVVECRNLFYCNAIGYLCDHSTYVHPSSSCISAYGAQAVHKVSSYLWPLVKVSQPRKLYIGRGAGRNLYNAAVVEKYFSDKGFEIVHPHLMSLEEKIHTFGNATHICGPVSSGFANLIFCKSEIKILGFFNFARCFDPFISGLSYAGGFNHEITFLTGFEDVNSNINNSYLIELDKIIECCENIKYLD